MVDLGDLKGLFQHEWSHSLFLWTLCAAGAEGTQTELELGWLPGFPLHNACCYFPPIHPEFQGEKMSVSQQKLFQEFPVLMGWRNQGNHRRGSAGHRSATFRFHLSVWWEWPEPKPPWHEPCYCCNDLLATSQSEMWSLLTRVLRKTGTRLDTGKEGASSKFCSLLSECALLGLSELIISYLCQARILLQCVLRCPPGAGAVPEGMAQRQLVSVPHCPGEPGYPLPSTASGLPG